MAAKARVAVVGVGHSRLFRRAEVALGVLGVEAVRLAIEDAGLEPSDIDGVSTAPDQPFEGAGDVDGLNVVSPEFLTQALKLDVAWVQRYVRTVAVGGSLMGAMHAVASGACKYAVCVRALHSPATRRYGHTDPSEASGAGQFRAPYGIFPPAVFGPMAHAHMHKYGSTREELAAFVVRNRDNALQWEYGYWAQYGGQPLTLDDYLNSRMISSPLCLFDCDIPVQTVAAFVVTTTERAKDLRHPPAYVLGMSNRSTVVKKAPMSLEEYVEDGQQVARHLWKNAGVGPRDVDVADLYDGFSVLTPLWAEALGFCGEGDGFAFVANPTLPLNPSSGNLGAGRTHGIGHILESILQIQGRSGPRQVPKAEICVAVTNPCNVGFGFVFSKTPN